MVRLAPAKFTLSFASDMCTSPACCQTRRIAKDLQWLDEVGGITDEMIRNISLVCDKNVEHQCNVKVTRLMIKDGEVYLNSLHPKWRLVGAVEFLGFLMELYETSKVYRWLAG
ncbi:hypothetical protein GPECTOR_142g706 [Gonium pectorale]|uniref:Uncharacterized protein n=1 Tax=Gonium pectorale TaxID=33097 RepID=A0A150FZ56_GONPE|nr:hypothetical protein GPECTOR_142g706 [Gonium pectorale]|eukprot:KXZ42485.1 hypothetical protein GPECTOR_142g706 [Gonium pectorale]